MKNPLRYQLSEYDCGPTSMINALAFLFEREVNPPEAVRNIMLYCLDCYGSDGVSGKSGTSCAAMMFLSNWLNGFGKIGRLHISTQYLSGPAVNFGQNSRLRDALRCGGAAVVRLHFDGAHYVTLTGIDAGLDSGEMTLHAGNRAIPVHGSFTKRQAAMLRAGGLLSYTKEGTD